jgi:hypothetical protein
MDFLEGGLDLMSHSQMSNSLKLTQREAREQSIASFVVRIMKLHLNWSDLFTCSIECSIEANLPDFVPYALKICVHADLPLRIVCPIKERWLANTTFHIAFIDFDLIREEKSLTRSNTKCRTHEATRGRGVNGSHKKS